MAETPFLPGNKAMLIYTDEHGYSRSSIIEIVDTTIFNKPGWRAIKARKEVFDYVFNVTPIKAYEIDVEDGWAISAVSEERLAPLGTRIFRIVQ